MEILFATDGLPPARAAGELLRRLTDPSRVNVTILFSEEVAEAGVDDSVVRGLEDTGAAMRGAGIATHVLRMTGDPVGSIEKAIAGQDFGLVVLGAGNHHWLGRLAFGSVSTADAARVSRARSPGPPDTGPRTRATPRARRRGRVTVGRDRDGHGGSHH